MEAGDNLPKEWDPMPPKTTCQMVTLDVNSSEYSTVKKYFEKTTLHTYQFVKIECVQNPVLYQHYMVKKSDMDQRNPANIENERKLFHGCSGDVTEKICHQGFNRNFAGKNGKV